MNICVLDGYTLNPGDLSWSELMKLGETAIYDRTSMELIVERAVNAEIILTNKTPLSRATLNLLPKLKYIGVLATGFDVVDIQAAEERGIVVTNIPAYGTESVAQMVFALLLEHCHRVQRHSDAVMEGQWGKNSDWCFWNYPLVELAGKTMGIVGLGSIGLQTARIASAFGMRILAYGRNPREMDLPNFRWCDLNELMRLSDVVSLHCPLTRETEGMINSENLSLMKRSAIIINTSRGKLINNKDLAEALNTGAIGGAGLDVLAVEPPEDSNPLLQAKNCLITPHISWATKEARSRLLDMAVDNIKAFIAKKPKNVVRS
ncbi:D-2-hydroxyacid dehydrogenase [Niallia endozanthoxylica]|uniref:D-2-hydroxyacid dehydrogenase n=1 Tax=Niallia endozanthoxylica TaxID=2036016 RepID=A0A5J5I744_9BACI|nr:D-2-hydroxyacid dehydrogenase [Niallia endozanthoxylica]KAA9029957.1 D-2-hydroxyacid dehydrogenase [Niallia endozanthoxylica]